MQRLKEYISEIEVLMQRLVGYAESHDEERLMYRNLLYGNVQTKIII